MRAIYGALSVNVNTYYSSGESFDALDNLGVPTSFWTRSMPGCISSTSSF